MNFSLNKIEPLKKTIRPDTNLDDVERKFGIDRLTTPIVDIMRLLDISDITNLKAGVMCAFMSDPTKRIDFNTNILTAFEKTSKKWGFPKGSAGIGDRNMLDVALRELYEETGIKLSSDVKVEFVISYLSTLYQRIYFVYVVVILDPKMFNLVKPDLVEIEALKLYSVYDLARLGRQCSIPTCAVIKMFNAHIRTAYKPNNSDCAKKRSERRALKLSGRNVVVGSDVVSVSSDVVSVSSIIGVSSSSSSNVVCGNIMSGDYCTQKLAINSS